MVRREVRALPSGDCLVIMGSTKAEIPTEILKSTLFFFVLPIDVAIAISARNIDITAATTVSARNIDIIAASACNIDVSATTSVSARNIVLAVAFARDIDVAAVTATSARNIDSSKKSSYNRYGGPQEVQDYWDHKTHGNQPLLLVVLSKLSPIYPSIKMEAMSAVSCLPQIDNPHILHLSLSYHPNPFDVDVSRLLQINNPYLLNLPSNYHPNLLDINSSGFDFMWQVLFFRESLMKEGKTIHFLRFGSNRSDDYFLPRTIVTRIQLFVNAVSRIFNISTDFAMYKTAKSTIDICRTPPNIGESKKCVTHAEDTIDYILLTLGADSEIQGWSTHNWSGFQDKISLIGKLKVVYDDKLREKQQLSCHWVPFPYPLYNCHSVSSTVFYERRYWMRRQMHR